MLSDNCTPAKGEHGNDEDETFRAELKAAAAKVVAARRGNVIPLFPAQAIDPIDACFRGTDPDYAEAARFLDITHPGEALVMFQLFDDDKRRKAANGGAATSI